MEVNKPYRTTSKMFSLIFQEPALLQMMSRFGIPLGVGDKTVEEVCLEHNVHPGTFITVANFIKFGRTSTVNTENQVCVECLMNYLKQAHSYFLKFQLPAIRHKLLEAIICTNGNDLNKVSGLIIKFFDEYVSEVSRHMKIENQKVFTYVEALLEGEKDADHSINRFDSSIGSVSHNAINEKIQELKNIIIKYYKPEASSDLLNSVLYDIFVCEEDMRRHCDVENEIFVPAVMRLENSLTDDCSKASQPDECCNKNELSEREKEIVALLVRGMKTKEIAEKLFISTHTVQTHRKNIGNKLNIHSISGLTIHALVNNIVKL